jgi:Virulence-associated protein E
LANEIIYGATPEEWEALAKLFGDAILPSVCSHEVKVSENSRIKSLFKLPSVISEAGTGYGIAGWQKHAATPKMVSTWSVDNRLGICASTRNIQAIDIDCATAEASIRMADYFTVNIGNLPMRVGRAGRCTLLVRVDSPEPLSKSSFRLKYDGGAVEFLAAGNQTMLAGMHTSGVRYFWPDGLPSSVPTISIKDFSDVWNAMSEAEGCGTELNTMGQNDRAIGTVLDSEDPFIQVLTQKADIRSADRKAVYITCPWISNHTDGVQPSETGAAYMLATSGQPANYRCQHDSCKSKNITHLHEHFDYVTDDFADVELVAKTWNHDPDWIRKATKDGQPTQEIANKELNLRVAFRYPELCGGREFRKDKFKAYSEMRPNVAGENEWGAIDKIAVTLIRNSLMDEKIGGFSLAQSDAIVGLQLEAYLADKATDSALQIIANLPVWDGVPRVFRLAPDVLRTKDTEYHRDVGAYLILTLVMRMANAKETDVQGTIILRGEQNCGKSHFIKSLPLGMSHTTLQLRNDLKEMTRRIQGHTVVDLDEMAGIRTAGSENIKTFISASVDAWRKHYAEVDESIPRRCIMVGSTNASDLLRDPSGGRRWFPMVVCDGHPTGVQANTGYFEKHKEQYYAEALAILGNDHESVVKKLYAKHQSSAGALAERREITASSVYHEEIKYMLLQGSMADDESVTSLALHKQLRIKADPSTASLNDIELSLMRLGCKRLDSSTRKYENIFFVSGRSLE